METKTILIAVVALVVGALGGHFLTWKTTMPEGHTMTMDSMIASMNAELEGKTGDEFDKAFLKEMTAHHMGAVQMAELALQHANHAEIKNMAQAIISAQNAEIDQMKQWQTAWYGTESEGTVHHAQ